MENILSTIQNQHAFEVHVAKETRKRRKRAIQCNPNGDLGILLAFSTRFKTNYVVIKIFNKQQKMKCCYNQTLHRSMWLCLRDSIASLVVRCQMMTLIRRSHTRHTTV